MSISLTTSNSPDLLPLLDYMTSAFNPYPLILQHINRQKQGFASPHLTAFSLALICVHFVLLIQAAITFGLKVFGKKKGEERFFWLYRKEYTSNEDLPYYVPNGNVLCGLFQLIGCLCFEWFAVTTYMERHQLLSPALRSSGYFGLAISFTPGFIGFWLSGWSVVYFLVFSSTRPDIRHVARKTYQHPLVMNTICIGIPVLITLCFVAIGIAFSAKHRELFDSFQILKKTLIQLSGLWQANDSHNSQNNKNLLNIVNTIQKNAREFCRLSELMALAWATVSLFIMMFYLATTFTLGNSMKQAILPMSEINPTYDEKDSESEDSKFRFSNSLNQSLRTDSSKSSAELLKSRLSLKRSYYFAYISRGVVILALCLHIVTSIILGLKAKVILVELQWQEMIFELFACTSVLLWVPLLLQSLVLIWG